MPTRRKNVDVARIKRSSKRSRITDYFSSAYVQYLLIFIMWGTLILISQSTEMRFEYFWPGWLFMCSIHDSLKYQGWQHTVVFVIIVITVDLICFFLVPVSWIYSCGSAYVWVYLLWHTDQGLCFLTLTFCFIFVYFELGFYSRDAKLNHSIYLFRPFAAHSIGYPVVCMGFSIKRYLDVRHRKSKKLDVRKQNCLYFRILREAIPLSALADTPGSHATAYLPDDTSNELEDSVRSDGSKGGFPWSLFLLIQAGKCFWTCFLRWALAHHTSSHDREFSSISAHPYQQQSGSGNSSHSVGNGVLPHSSPSSDGTGKRGGSEPNGPSPDPHLKGTGNKQSNQSKGTGRSGKEDLTTRLEYSVRRLRTEIQSMRAVESQLRTQLTNLQRDDRLNRLSLSNQRQENESLSSRIAKLITRSRTDRSSLAAVEQSLAEEKRFRQTLEEQLVEVPSDSRPNDNSSSSKQVTKDAQSSHNQEDSKLESANGSDVDVVEASCCQRRHLLESEVYNLRLTSRQQDEQLHALSAVRPSREQASTAVANKKQNHAPTIREEKNGKQSSILLSNGDNVPRDGKPMSSHRKRLMMETYLQLASEERERLANTLREENWMKQELLTAYHTSVREITELNKTLKQRDFQILELTMKIEQLERLTLPDGTLPDKFTSRANKELSPSSLCSFNEKQLNKLSALVTSVISTTISLGHVNIPSQSQQLSVMQSAVDHYKYITDEPFGQIRQEGNKFGQGLQPMASGPFSFTTASSTVPVSLVDGGRCGLSAGTARCRNDSGGTVSYDPSLSYSLADVGCMNHSIPPRPTTTGMTTRTRVRGSSVQRPSAETP
ncbi:unnamed protein product [Calicophoron daubneyi]|uniref:Macoilin n=1 Tax=Calicophoron daubneyi TaxID=300641 RepID=A0AAV2TVU1_CALDB